MKNKLRNLLLVSLAIIAVTVGGLAQIKNTENTLKLAEGQTGEKASIADVAWLAGYWSGPGLGGIAEETWGKPSEGIMVGTFRLSKDQKPVFYEVCWLLEHKGTLLLRLKHFHANLVGWEEKDKTVDFKYVKRDGERIYFNGLTFERLGPYRFNIYLALTQKDLIVREETFKLKKVQMN